MSRATFDYNEMTETALRGVVREALARAEKTGLPGNHHFYVTFRTQHPGVAIADHLRTRYPEEMTIVIQHQYWALEAGEEAFSVTLSFNRVHERLTVPYMAITAFADPSVQFGLQFRAAAGGASADLVHPAAPPVTSAASGDAGDAKKPSGEVVTLDTFRKK